MNQFPQPNMKLFAHTSTKIWAYSLNYIYIYIMVIKCYGCCKTEKKYILYQVCSLVYRALLQMNQAPNPASSDLPMPR